MWYTVFRSSSISSNGRPPKWILRAEQPCVYVDCDRRTTVFFSCIFWTSYATMERSSCLIVLQLLLFVCSTPRPSSGLLKSKSKLQYCERSHSRCVDMNHSICLGVKLPYTSTSTDLVMDSDSPEDAQVRVRRLSVVTNCMIIIWFLFIGQVALLARTQKGSKMLGGHPTTFMCTVYA